MEGNQGRTIANIVRTHERSGKLWLVIAVLIALGTIIADRERVPSEVERSEIARCEPLTVTPDMPEEALQALLDAGSRLVGGEVYPAGCESYWGSY